MRLTEKQCRCCGEVKDTDSFDRRPDSSDGFNNRCKSCGKEYYRDYHVKRTYGITPERYAELLFLQNGVCAICKMIAKPGKRLHVDHDHETGEIRGLLCVSCNAAIGHLRDDPLLLEAARLYLVERVA